MQVVVRNRTSHGFHFQTAFTWAKLFDTTQGEGFQEECCYCRLTSFRNQ
jgi:hypothetical protein